MAEISVIVPFYNVEDYIGECLDSLLQQSFDDMEILCINDGSTDSSLDIVNEYSERDDRIRVFTQENQGPAPARNLGLDNASGEFIYFMDADDILKDCALERIHGLAVEKDLDLVIFKMINFRDETGERFSTKYYDMAFLKKRVGDNVFSHYDLEPEEVFRVTVSPPSKLFRRSLIGDIRFPCGLVFEDNPFFVEAFLRAERVYFDDTYLYERRIRDNSLMTSSNRNFMDFIEISEMLIQITKRYGLYDRYKRGLYLKTIDNLYRRFTQIGDEYKREFFERIKEYFETKREEYDSDEEFTQGDERLKKVFYNALECDDYRAYEQSIRDFDLKRKKQKAKSKAKKNQKSSGSLGKLRKLFKN